ncbi:hypothetical protein ASD00_32110 [Ensifer sp. Root31]|uniref:DoxX family protein n=1 Tax=Ensifer sp. Root31 TaxID=1736512 RepID=UPI000708BD5F|nr:DoxX family protein [Ensifer sp. Root31]KQU85637.1 hypothetical protein ASD00_32110 [Ensifer sp. Root31]
MNVAEMGRVLLGAVFVFAGLRNIGNRETIVAVMAKRGVPWPRVALFSGVLLQVIAGGAIVFGVYTAGAMTALAIFLVLATVISFDFWRHQGGDRTARLNGFIANAALIGAILATVNY